MTPAPIQKTVKRGALYIHVRKYADGRYGFDYEPDQYSREKVRLKNLGDAVERADQLLGLGHAGKASLLSINPDEFAEFLQWKARKRVNTPNIPELVETLLASKEGKGRSEWTIESLQSLLRPFGRKFPCALDELTRDQVEEWLNGRSIGARRFNNITAAIVTLCRFARRSGHLGNDLLPIEHIDRKFHRPRVETYSTDELKAILGAVPREWAPTIILGAFAGLRPEECAPDPRTSKPGLTWQNVHWRRGSIEVPPEVAKGSAGGQGRRRFVPILPATAAWLEPWRHAVGRVAPMGVRFSNLKRAWKLPVDWKQDGLRHSFASYRLALIHSIPQLSIEMGNSIAMCKMHYLDAKFPEEAEEWFGIQPPAGWNAMELSARNTA